MICSVSEMYDLCTVKDKMSLIGIHTPTMGLIARSWKGFCDNYKYVKLLKCDVKIACASHLPVDPLQVGADSNQISPQDMMNPILYRAVTNDSWNTVINRLYNVGATDRNSLRYFSDAFPGSNASAQERLYYALLASSEWRKAMPQVGLSMTNLKPFVYQVVNTYGNRGTETGTMDSTNLDVGLASTGAGAVVVAPTGQKPLTFRGHAMPYPAVPCSSPGSSTESGMDFPALGLGYIPKSYVGCILMPPNKSGFVMYYRLLITWTVEFIKPVPVYEKYVLTDAADVGVAVHQASYIIPANKADDIVKPENDKIDGEVVEGNTLDTVDAPLELVYQK